MRQKLVVPAIALVRQPNGAHHNVSELRVNHRQWFEGLYTVSSLNEWEVHVLDASRVITKDHNRQLTFKQEFRAICETANKRSALVYDGIGSRFEIFFLFQFS